MFQNDDLFLALKNGHAVIGKLENKNANADCFQQDCVQFL